MEVVLEILEERKLEIEQSRVEKSIYHTHTQRKNKRGIYQVNIELVSN